MAYHRHTCSCVRFKILCVFLLQMTQGTGARTSPQNYPGSLTRPPSTTPLLEKPPGKLSQQPAAGSAPHPPGNADDLPYSPPSSILLYESRDRRSALFPAATFEEAVQVCRAWGAALVEIHLQLDGLVEAWTLLSSLCHDKVCWLGRQASTEDSEQDMVIYGGPSASDERSKCYFLNATEGSDCNVTSLIGATSCHSEFSFICSKAAKLEPISNLVPLPNKAPPNQLSPTTAGRARHPPPSATACKQRTNSSSILIRNFFYQLMPVPVSWESAKETTKRLGLEIPNYSQGFDRQALDTLCCSAYNSDAQGRCWLPKASDTEECHILHAKSAIKVDCSEQVPFVVRSSPRVIGQSSRSSPPPPDATDPSGPWPPDCWVNPTGSDSTDDTSYGCPALYDGVHATWEECNSQKYAVCRHRTPS